MPKRCPQLIDYLYYTESRKVVEGDIALSECKRLYDLVSPESNPEHVFHIQFEFGVDEYANRYVKGHVTGQLELICQRCMNAFDFPIDINLALAFIKNKKQEQEIAGLYDSFYLENSEPIDFYALIEDEIILSLPLIAKHEDENCICKIFPQDKPQLDKIDIAYRQEQQQKLNPFAVLDQLKK